ncbi:MAG TPA: CoA-transferase [Paracoccaceae bacterium]|nr:CoA-transferase [Paracoccaceae bacterium]
MDRGECDAGGPRGLRRPRRGPAKGIAMSPFTPDEMMTIAAARALSNDDVCFVGIGPPSAACNVARLTHAPDITLIYESGRRADPLPCPAARRRLPRSSWRGRSRCR